MRSVLSAYFAYFDPPAIIRYRQVQAVTGTTYNLACMNLMLHKVKDSEFDIFHGDVSRLLEEAHMTARSHEVEKERGMDSD